MILKFTHLDEDGNARMVDVSGKADSVRTAAATGEVRLSREVTELVKQGKAAKGDVLTTAKIAGIQAAKKTSELIPLCHNIFISHIDLAFSISENNSTITISSLIKTSGVTGAEMEALTAVSVAALTIYDMCKAVDKSILISNIHLVSKTGGKSGDFYYQEKSEN